MLLKFIEVTREWSESWFHIGSNLIEIGSK
jgi:hypothetical protein